MVFLKFKTFLLMACLLVFHTVQANETEVQSRIQFDQGDSWASVLKKAQREGKPIFVDVYTVWCGPCKMMERNTFTQQEVYDIYNNNFINYKLNFETPEGQKLGAKYGISGVPVLLYFDSRGELLYRADGMQGKVEMIQYAKRVLARAGSRNNSRPDQDFADNRTNYSSTYEEIIKRYNTKQPYDKLFRQYAFKQKLLGRMDNKKNMDLIYDLSDDIESKAMDMFINRQGRFIAEYGEEHIHGKVKSSVLSKMAEATANRDEDLFKRALEVVNSFDMPQGANLAYSLQCNYYKGIGDRKGFAKVVINYMKKYNGKAPDVYNRSAWDIMTSDPSKANLKYARDWVETSIALDSQYYNNETYGEILVAMGKRKAACEAFQEAIRLGRKTKRDTTTAQEKLNKYCR